MLETFGTQRRTPTLPLPIGIGSANQETDGGDHLAAVVYFVDLIDLAIATRQNSSRISMPCIDIVNKLMHRGTESAPVRNVSEGLRRRSYVSAALM